MPIKLSSITNLERDGSNFQNWKLDLQSYVVFTPDIVGYLSIHMDLDLEWYEEDFAKVVKIIMHWTINRELALTLRDILHPAGQLSEIHKQISGVSLLPDRQLLSALEP